MNHAKVTLLSDKDWSSIDGEICLVTEFSPIFSEVKDGKVETADQTTPYASIVLECPKIKGRVIGFITNKTDFAMLWAAFKEPRKVPGVHVEVVYEIEKETREQEVWLVWTKKRYKRGIGTMSKILPKLIVMISSKGAYELITNPNSKPELSGQARFMAERPLATWTPDVMER